MVLFIQGQDKLAPIFQTTPSIAFSWMEMFEFRIGFHQNLFLKVQLTIFQPWFRYGLALSDTPVSESMMGRLLTHICVTRPQSFISALIVLCGTPWHRLHDTDSYWCTNVVNSTCFIVKRMWIKAKPLYGRQCSRDMQINLPQWQYTDWKLTNWSWTQLFVPALQFFFKFRIL